MALRPGTKLGPYQIGEPLGAGGMGEVYRARDTRLERSVAIKVLSTHLSGRPELKQRFEREARTVSSLNHPHICTLYDIGSQDGVDFLVMELLEGETLADRLAYGRGRSSRGAVSGASAPDSGSDSSTLRALKFPEAMEIALQIADGLDRAHRQGVVHRDLKPGNIMLTTSGAKLLDFGLAKQAQPAASLGSSSLLATEAVRPITGEGTILGTVQYMAPEQLEGQEADARTDIFAFGTVLYEMVTGRRAFEGKSQVSLIAAIVDHDPPPLSSVAPVSPPLLDHLVKTCLAKNPDKRWQSMADVLLQLRLIAEGTALGAPADTAAATRQRRLAWMAAAAAGVLLAAIPAVSTFLLLSAQPEPRQRIQFDVETPVAGSPNQIALSPLGTHIVGQTNDDGGRLWLRALENPAGQVVPGSDSPSWPFWSADGRFIGFFAGGKLKKVDLQGAPPQTLADAPSGLGGTWNGEDVIVFAPDNGGPLFQVPAAGGVAVALTALSQDRQEVSHRHPWFLPDGRRFLYVALSSTPAHTGIYVGSLDGGESLLLVNSGLRAAFSPPDRLLFMRENALMAQPFDPDRLQLSGNPLSVAEEVGVAAGNSAAGFSVSNNGMVVYRPDDQDLRTAILTWFDREGTSTPALPAPAEYQDPALSPDGRFVAVSKVDRSTFSAHLWVVDLQRGTETRFTFEPAVIDRGARWSPDGSYVAFNRNAGGKFQLYRKNVSGVVPEELLHRSNSQLMANDWSPDGQSVVYRESEPRTSSDVMLLPLTGEKKPQPLVRSPFSDQFGRVSPDGRWLAYQSNESGRVEVYVVQYPVARSRVQISTAGGAQPRWRGDSKELFFLANPAVMAADIGVAANGELQPGVPRKLFDVRGAQGQYDVARDGRRFLFNIAERAGDNTSQPIRVILNWDRRDTAAGP